MQIYALIDRHLGIVAPFGGTIGFVVEIVEVVHVLVGFHLERIEAIAGIGDMTARVAPPAERPGEVHGDVEPEGEVFYIETEPRVVGATGLIEMNHLMVSQRAEAREGLGLLRAMGDDVTEERHALVAPLDPAGLDNSGHVADAAGARRAQHHQENIHCFSSGG